MSGLASSSLPLPAACATLPEALARIAALELQLHQAQAASRQLRSVTDHLRQGLLLLDATGTVQLINEQYCRLLELPQPAEQWLGQPMEALVQLVLERVADPVAYAAELTQARTAPISQLNALLLLRSGRKVRRRHESPNYQHALRCRAPHRRIDVTGARRALALLIR